MAMKLSKKLKNLHNGKENEATFNSSCESSVLISEKCDIITNPILKVLLEGIYEDECILSKLRGTPHLIQKIWNDVMNYWKKKIILPPETVHDSKEEVFYPRGVTDFKNFKSFKSKIFFAPLHWSKYFLEENNECLFPPPSDININMMPFIVGEDFKVRLDKAKILIITRSFPHY